ncbi:aspartate dehydrogenase [Pseudochelatococcus sp. B33]
MTHVRNNNAEIRVAVAGAGAAGGALIEALDAGVPGCVLSAISARDLDAARERFSHLKSDIAFVPVGELEALADLVVECAPSAIFTQVVEPFLRAGKKALVLSSGALLSNMQMVDLARRKGGQIIVPTGALLGLDAVTAAAEGTIHSVRMLTRKPVRGLLGAPHLVKNGIDISSITEPVRVFKGTPREAAIGFPANLNVAVALSLAGIGPDRTELEIWADPNLNRNYHDIEVDSDSAKLKLSIENIPTENPKTGRITALSVVAALRKMNAPLRVGT